MDHSKEQCKQQKCHENKEDECRDKLHQKAEFVADKIRNKGGDTHKNAETAEHEENRETKEIPTIKTKKCCSKSSQEKGLGERIKESAISAKDKVVEGAHNLKDKLTGSD
uniref:Late embryogenesis abundant protein D-29-like n=1 Tax=Rhabditophanes sp. KR3021 TaxID=114890 RepID=A0AC35UBH8_9BILA